MRVLTILAAALLTLSLAACKKNIQTKEAVQDAVVKHLSSRTDLSLGSMKIEVTNVTFSEKKAIAMVSFTPKSGENAPPMSLQYTLEQEGSAWVVKSKGSGGASGHGGAAGAPPAGMPGRDLPPNHPPMGAPSK